MAGGDATGGGGFMGGPIGQIGMPLAYGAASAMSPAAARGGMAGMRMQQFMQQQAADRAVRQLGESMMPPDLLPSEAGDAMMAGTPGQDYQHQTMKLISGLLSSGGMRAAPTAVAGATRMADMMRKYEQPIAVDGSLYNRETKEWESAPVRDPFRQSGGNIYNTTTGEASLAPSVTAELEAGAGVREARADAYAAQARASDSLVNQRQSATELNQQKIYTELNRAMALMREAAAEGPGGKSRAAALKIYGDLLENPELDEQQLGLVRNLFNEAAGGGAQSPANEETQEGVPTRSSGIIPQGQWDPNKAKPTGRIFNFDGSTGQLRPGS